MEEAENADRVLVMDSGSIVMDGTPKEVFSNPNMLKKSGLSLPQTVSLLSALKEKLPNIELGYISPKDAASEIAGLLGGITK
jgi:ABC-type glutathione transport system ATPase component